MSDTLLAHYQAVEATTEQMLHAAQRHDWPEVSRLESACAEGIAKIRAIDQQSARMSPPDMARKQRIMLAILRHDAQIRSLAEPWMTQLDQLIHPTKGQLH